MKKDGDFNRATADIRLVGDQDRHLFNEGTHLRLYNKLGAQVVTSGGVGGTHFAVWAPDAEKVYVMGDFNRWNKTEHELEPSAAGIWQTFIPGIEAGAIYKYHIVSKYHGYRVDKADPFAFHSEIPPNTGSIVWDLDHQWNDQQWMQERQRRNAFSAPMSIYEIHFGSWKRVPEQDSRFLSYREMAPQLADYLLQMGFTHVEFMPLTEHPFFGSWGYQTTGYYCPTSRYGTPQDLMYLIDYLHQHGIGVILDWVPSHFPTDEHGLAYFDGTHLYEHGNPQQGYHPDWSSYIFNYGRNEVRSFLLSSALFWLDKYHIDGLRVDAVASMLYLDYSRKEGEWVPNRYGGRENIDAIDFLRRFNEEMYGHYPDVQTIAEESTAWPMVSRPAYVGGLGFGMKWDMGWMHDTLLYMSKDPIHRKYQHSHLTFRMLYAFNENFALPLSHDEVVHGKGSLLGKMPGDPWQRFANLRSLFGYMYGQPGKKLLFMGGEIGQWDEWKHDSSLDWHLLEYPFHAGLQKWVQSLNRVYRQEPALHDSEFEPVCFEWIDASDWEQSTVSFLRRSPKTNEVIAVICNFTPVPRYNYRLGVPQGGIWVELLNSDAREFEGSGHGNFGRVEASPFPFHGRPYSLYLTLPPLGTLFLKPEGEPR